MSEELNTEEAQQEVIELHDRVLLKTALKGSLYLLTAYVVTYFYPEQIWVWYVAGGLVLFGMGFVLFTKFLSYKLSKNSGTVE